MRYDDVGLPWICHEYVWLPLVIQDDVLGNGLVKSCKKSEQRYREQVVRVREVPRSCKRRKLPGASQNLTCRPQSHDDTDIQRGIPHRYELCLEGCEKH